MGINSTTGKTRGWKSGKRVLKCQGARVPGCQSARVPRCQSAKVPRVRWAVRLEAEVGKRRRAGQTRAMDEQSIAVGFLWFLAFLFSTTVHEAMHALAALRGGDPTAYHGGQVSLSPIPHIRREPVG